ncbi:MAG: PRC-barrel domain-containing protein [Cyclobacteriaceae bacterium]
MRHWIGNFLLSTTVCVGMTVMNLEFEKIGTVEKTIIEAHTGRLTGLLIQVSEEWLATVQQTGKRVVSPISSLRMDSEHPNTVFWNMPKEQLNATLCPPNC